MKDQPCAKCAKVRKFLPKLLRERLEKIERQRLEKARNARRPS
jgi:hypothetical protein